MVGVCGGECTEHKARNKLMHAVASTVNALYHTRREYKERCYHTSPTQEVDLGDDMSK